MGCLVFLMLKMEWISDKAEGRRREVNSQEWLRRLVRGVIVGWRSREERKDWIKKIPDIAPTPHLNITTSSP